MTLSEIPNRMTMAIAALLAPALVMMACSASAPAGGTDEGGGTTGAGGGGGGGDEGGICLLNNCSSDLECAGCNDGRDTCLVEENRCVACDPTTGEGCPEGEACTSFGLCAPEGQTCPTDDHGEPTITCSKNEDCAACSPMHQVCDTDTGTCQACTDTNTQHCLQSDICVDGKCSSKCPSSCSTDNDCMHCGSEGNEAHACNAHKCAECSDTYSCPAGLECVSGSCVPQCGIPGPTSGDCLADEDCKYCGDADDTSDAWVCSKPLNQNGPNDHGTCAPAAAGCSDLGNGVAVLPEPWNEVTNLCSNDSDCSGVGIQYNVGELIRDAVGSDKLDLGFAEVEIQDATVSYDMGTCADVELTDDLSCGVCVPCTQDSDCEPINVDNLVSDLFAGDPLAQIAGAFLLDLLWGKDQDHDINFQCQAVAAGYGVCAPCSNPFQPCGSNQGGGGESSTCDHDVCTTGGALGSSCDSCASKVCQNDPYCCNTAWDDLCVKEVAQYCGTNTCGGGGGSTSCAHSECTTGGALDPTCSTCAQNVCAYDSYCCDNTWDSICVGHVDTQCGADACDGGGTSGGGSCAHDVCTEGDKLDANCSTCAGAVCNADSYCCDTQWDAQCVQQVDQYCSSSCGSQSTCAHSECSEGAALTQGCSSCVDDVCAQDSYCCNNTWDSICVDLAKNSSACSC